MGTIPQDLTDFKKKVEPKLSDMESSYTGLTEKVETCSTLAKTAQNDFSSAYTSENKQTILKKFDNISNLYTKISTSLSNDLGKMVSTSKEIVEAVTELEDINKKIEEQQKVISGTKTDDKEYSNIVSTANSEIDKLNKDFTKKSEDAEDKLKALKGMDADLQFVKDFTSTDYLSKIDQLNGGSFEKASYKASNGVVVNYYIWIPNYGEEVEGLPVHMYLHGSGETGTGVLNHGLPKLIADGSVVPEGIVICPQASSYNDFYNKEYHAALVELTTKVANENNGDTNKISLSGHSMGAIGGYKMINEFPGHFAAFMPISGNGNLDSGIQQTKIWAFHGNLDNGQNTDYSRSAQLVREMQKLGKVASLHTFQGMGHAKVQEMTFQGEYDDCPDGERKSALEWAFRQSLIEA